MDEINDNLVPLTNATPEDLNEALEGQPEPVKEDKPFKNYMDRVAVDDVNLDDMAYTDDDGNVRLYNSQDGYVGLDLDPLEDRTFVSGLKKGFTYTNPDDLYDKSQEAQPFYEKMINGTLQFVGDTTLNVAQGIGGTFYGLGSAIANRDLTKFYDNSVTNALDEAEKWWGQTFEVKTGGNQAWYNKFGNFVFNDFFGGLSFLVGAVATEAILTGVSTLSLGAAAPIQGMATTGLVARGARILKQMGHRGKRLVGGKLYDDAVKGIDQLGTNATRVQAVTGMTQAGRQVGRAQRNNALARMSRQIMTGAGMEASMEARHALHESVEDFKRRYEEVNGRGSFTPEMEEKALQEFSKTTDSTFWQNLALVGVSNMLMFPKLFGYGGGKAMRYVGLKDVNKMSTARKTRLAKRLGVTVEDLPKYVEGRTGIKGLRNAMFAFDDMSTFGLGKHTRLGRLARATAIARRGLYEGVVEEGGQGVMSRYAKNYIEAAYDLDLQKKEVDKQRALMEGFGGAYTSAQGLTEIGIGVMLGVMGAPWGKVTRDSQGKAKFQFQLLGGAQEVRNRIKERDAEIQGIIDLHEANGDVLGIMGAEIRNSLSQQALQRDYNAAALAGDFKRLKDVEQNQIFSHAASKIITGRYEDALVEAKEILDDMTAEDYREMLGDQGANMTTEELETRKRHVYDNYVKHMEAAKKAFEQAGDIYRGDMPEVYSAIANMMYNVEANDFREKALADKITQVLVDLNRGQILDASRIKAELGIREEDIEKLLAIREKLRRIEKGLETKFKRGIIKNVNIEKAEARFEEDSKARKEVEKLRDQEKALVDSFLSRRTAQEAVDNEYGFDLDRQVERINALIDMHAALDAISLVDTDLDVQDIQTTVNDLFEISQDRLELIRMHNNLLERGGVQRLVDNVSTIIQAKINSYVDEDERARNRDKDKEGTDLPNDKVREGQDADTAVDTDVPIDPDEPGGTPETGEAAEVPENMFDPEDAPPVEEEEEGPAPDDVPVSDLSGSGTQGASQSAENRKQQAKAREEQQGKRTDTTVEEKPNSTRKSDEQKDNKAGLLYFDIDDVRGLKEGTTMVQRHIAVRGTGGMVFKAFMVPGDSRVHIEVDGELSDPEIRDAYQGEDALLMTLSRAEAEKRFGPEAFAVLSANNSARQPLKFRLGGTGEGVYGGARVQYRRGNTIVGGPIRVNDRLEGNLDSIVDVVYQVTSSKFGNVWFSAVTGNDISKQADKEVLEFVTDTNYGVGMKNFVSAGRPYLVVRDGRTGKLAWSQIRGATIGKDTAHFLHRTLEVLNVASGTLELDKTTMTQEAYDKSKQVLEDVFDVNFGLEGKELQKEFKKVASFITGRKVFSEFNEVRQWQKNTKAGTSQWSLVVHNDRPAELVVMPAGFNPFQELRDENGEVITNQAGKPRRIKSSWSSYDVNGDYLMYLAQIPQGIEMAQRPMAKKGIIFSDLRLGENKELVANGVPVKEYIGRNYNFIDRAPMWITDPISGEKVLYAHRIGNLVIDEVDDMGASRPTPPPAGTENTNVKGQSSSEENENLPAWLQIYDDDEVQSNVTTADPSSDDDVSGDTNTETELSDREKRKQEKREATQQKRALKKGEALKAALEGDSVLKVLNAISDLLAHVEKSKEFGLDSYVPSDVIELARRYVKEAEEQGYEMTKLLGKAYDPGLLMEAEFVVGDVLEPTITEILRPEIRKDGKVVQSAKVVVTLPDPELQKRDKKTLVGKRRGERFAKELTRALKSKDEIRILTAVQQLLQHVAFAKEFNVPSFIEASVIQQAKDAEQSLKEQGYELVVHRGTQFYVGTETHGVTYKEGDVTKPTVESEIQPEIRLNGKIVQYAKLVVLKPKVDANERQEVLRQHEVIPEDNYIRGRSGQKTKVVLEKYVRGYLEEVLTLDIDNYEYNGEELILYLKRGGSELEVRVPMSGMNLGNAIRILEVDTKQVINAYFDVIEGAGLGVEQEYPSDDYEDDDDGPDPSDIPVSEFGRSKHPSVRSHTQKRDPKKKKLTPMQRANRNLRVRGLTVQQTEETVNILTGLAAQYIQRHRVSVKREKDIVMRDIKREVHKELGRIMRVQFSRPGFQDKLSKQQFNAIKNLLEGGQNSPYSQTFDRAFVLTLQRLMSNTHGMIDISANNMQKLEKINEQIASFTDEDYDREDLSMKEFEDKFSFTIDPKATQGRALRQALMGIGYTHADANTRTFLGILKFVTHDQISGTLSETLNGVEPTYPEVEQRLENAVAKYPYLQSVLDALDLEALSEEDPLYRNKWNMRVQLRQQMVVFGARDYTNFVSTKFKIVGREFGTVYQFNSNDRNMGAHALENFLARLITNNFYTYDPKGNARINKPKFKAFVDQLDAITKSDTTHADKAAKISKLFQKELKLNVPAHIFSSDVRTMENIEIELQAGNETMEPSTAFGHFRAVMRAASTTKDVYVNINSLPQTQRFKEFFFLVASQGENLIQKTSKDAAGNVRYQYVQRKLLSDRFRHLRDRFTNEDIEAMSPSMQQNRFIKTFQEGDPKNIRVDHHDSFNRLRSSLTPKEWLAMSPAERKIDQLIMYGNDNNYRPDRSGRRVMIARFAPPTISDKSTLPLIQTESRDIKVKTGDMVTRGRKKWFTHQMPIKMLKMTDFIDVNHYYKKNIYHLVEEELTRIVNIREKNFDNLPTEAQREAEALIHFPTLNQFLDKYDIATLNGRQDFHKAAKKEIQRLLDKDFQHTLEQLEQAEVFDTLEDNEDILSDDGQTKYTNLKGTIKNLRFFNIGQLRSRGDTTGKSDLEFMLNHLGIDPSDIDNHSARKVFLAYVAKYTAESRAVRAHTIQFVMGDVGVYWKGSVRATVHNIQKRLASLIAPGEVKPVVNKELIPETPGVDSMGNTYVDRLVVNDHVMKAQNMTDLKKILSEQDLKAYEKIVATDGAEWITPRERLLDLLGEGRITPREFHGLLTKAEAGIPLENAEKAWFRPGKPVAAGFHGDHHFYVKSAEFVLLPEDIKGTSFTRLYDLMMDPQIMIGRITHRSAYKVGIRAGSVLDIYEEDGTIRKFTKKEIQELRNMEHPARYRQHRETMRRQQEVPAKQTLETVHGSQVSKLFNVQTHGLTGFNEYGEFDDFEFEGELKGEDLQGIYNATRLVENQAKMALFRKRYGVGTPAYKEKMAVRLMEEALTRGYDFNEVAGLHFDSETGKFAVPLWGTASAGRIDSLMFSILYNEVIKPKINGFGGPIAPETGWRVLSIDDAKTSGIAWVVDKKGKTLWDGKRLKTLSEGGVDEIILPWKFKEDITKYIDKDGNISTDKLDDKLLNIFGYRLPTQSKASASTFRVVGFSRPEMGDRIIVAEELVGRIGQDYDIDKLMTFLYNYEEQKDKKGNRRLVVKDSLTKDQIMSEMRRNGDRVSDEAPMDYDSMSEEELQELIEAAQNTMIDAYHSVMRNSNPEVQKYIHEPIGDGYAEQLAEIVGEREDQDLDPYGVEYNDYTTADASAALDALGVFASQSALHGVINMNQLDVYFASGNFYNVVQVGASATTGLMHNGQAVKPWMLAKFGKNEIVDSEFVLKAKGYNPVAGTVSKQFNRLMNHSVDNQNNGLLGRLRISKETYPLWTMLTHMGYNQETIELIVQSEVARDVVREAQTKNSMTASFFQLDDHLKRRIFYTRLDLLQTFLTKDEKKLEGLSGTELENAVQVAMGRLQAYRKKNGYVYDLNKDWLVADFQGRKLPKRERLMHEIAIMEAWRSTIRSSNKLLSWNRTMRLDTKFPRHREEMNMRMQQAQDFYNPMASINLELGLGIPRGIQMADGIGFGNYRTLMRMEGEASKLAKAIGPDYRKDPRYKAMRAQINAFKDAEHDRMRRIILEETSVGQLTSALFQLRQEGALSMADEHLDETYLYRSASAYFREQGNSEKKLRQYILGLRSYHFAKLAEKIDGERTAKQMRAAFMDTDGTNLPARITQVMSKYPGLRKNAFLRHLVLNTSRDAHGYYTVEFTGDRNLTVSSQEPLAAFLDLLTHKNAEIRAVGEDLVKYALVTGGNLGSRSFTKYVVNEYLEQNGLRAEMIGQVERDSAFWGTDAHAQIVMHNHDLIPRSEFFVQRLQYENKEDDYQATSISFKRGDRNAPNDIDPTLSFGFVRDARTRRPYRIGRYMGLDKDFFQYELIPLEGRKGDFLHKEYGSDFEFSPEIQRTRPDANPGQQDNNEPPADLFDEDGPDMMGVSEPDPNDIPVSDMMGTGTETDPAPEVGSTVDTESTQITYKGQTYTVTYSDQPGPDGRIAGGKIINNKTGREVNVTGPTGSKVLDLWIESQEMTEEPPDPNDVPISNFGQGKFGFPRNKPAGIIEQPLSLMQSVSIVYQLRGELKAIGTREEYAEYLLSRMGNTSLPQVLWHAGSARYGKPKLPTKDEVRASGSTLMKNEAGEFQPAVYLSNDITDAASYLASKDSIPELYGALVLDGKARLLPMKDTFDQKGYYQDEQGRYRHVETKQVVAFDKGAFDTQFRAGESTVVMRGIDDLALGTKWGRLGAMGLKLREFLKERDMGPQSDRYPSTVAVRDVDKVVLLGSVEDRQAFAAWKQNKQQSVTAVPRTRIIVPTTQNPLRRFVERGDMSTNPLLESFSLMEDALPMHMRVNFEAQTDRMGITYYDANRHTIVARADISEQELTHEMVHAYTVWATENEIPAQAEMALSRIKRLRRELTEDKAAMMQMGLTIKELNKFRRGYKQFFKMEDVVNNEKYMGNRRLYRSELTAEQNADIDFFLDTDNYDRMYGFMNDQEFMAEALSNPVFANQLARVPSGVMSGPRRRGGFRNQHTRNMWEKVMAFIADVLEGMGVAYGDNMATEVAYYASRVMSAKAEQARKADPSQAKRYPKPPSVSYSARSRTRKKRPSGDNVNALVQYKRIRIQELREVRAKFSGSDSVLKSIDTRIARETEDLELLTDDSVGADKVAAMVRRELDDMDQMLDRMAEVKTPTLGVLTSLRSMQTTLSFYAGFGGKIKLEGMDRETMRELVGRANSMMDEYMDIMREVLRMAARERYAGTPSEERVKDDSFKNIDPVNWARANLLGAGRQGRIEHSFLDDVIKDMYQRQRADYNQRVKKYDELSAKFKTTDYYLKHGWDGLVELDADGNPTNRIISPLSGTWTQEEHRRRSIALAEKTDEAWQSYYKWLQEHTGRIDIERLYELDKRVVTRKADLVYERQLEKTYGKLGAEEFLKRQDKLIKNYADARQSAFDVIDMELPGEANKAANKQRKLEWLDLNSPAKHYLYYEKGVDRPANAKNRYLAHMPLPEVNGKKTGFYDERFVDMQKEPEAVAYYEYLRGQFKELMAGLPMDIYADNLHQIEQGLFLPGMRKAMTVSLMNPRAMVRRQADKFVESITTVDEEIQSRMIDPITGEVRRDIPVKYMQRLRDTTNQEFNMDIVYKKFTMMATNFIAKNMIEDVVRLTETAIANAGITHTDTSGNRVIDSSTGEPLVSTDAGRRKNVLAAAEASIREFYGQQSQKKAGYLLGKKRPRTAEEKARAKEIDDKIREADIALEQNRMDPENHSALVMKLQEERDKIGSRVDGGKLLRGLLKFTQARGMGYNVPAAFTNYVFGAMSVYQYAARRTDFDERDADKAFHLMLHRTLSAVTANTGLTRTGTARKIAAMMVRYDILKDFSEVQYDPTVDKTTFDKLVEKTLLYQMQRSSEYFVYGHSTIAALLGTKIGDKNAWELMDEDGIIDVEGYRPGEVEFNKLAGRINQINMAIHGNYDIQSPIAFKQTLVGPALMQFKSWLPEAMAQEFGSRVYDTQLGREVQGSFQALYNEPVEFMRNIIIPKALLPVLRRHATYNFQDPVNEESARRAYAKIYQIMQLYFLYAFLGAMVDDEDDPQMRQLLTFMLNIASRVRNDMMYFYKPSAFLDLTRGGAPAIETLADVFKFSDAVFKTMQGDGTIPTGIYAGRSRMLHHGGNLIPYGKAINRQLYNMTVMPND